MTEAAEIHVLYSAEGPIGSAEIGHYETDAKRGALPIRFDDLNGPARAAWGLSEDEAARLSAKRAEPAEGAADIDDDGVEANTEYDDIDALASALFEEETTLKEQGLSPTLRLHPPRGGHDGIKHPGKEGGMLGKQETEEIDALLEAMR
mgnify:CR=1 FL=1